MNLTSKKTLGERLRRGRKARETFVESHITQTRAHQIRAMRDEKGWTQQELASAIGTNQNAVYRLESSSYGQTSLTTLKRVAAAFDVALIVRFVPYSELVDWVSGSPRVELGLRTSALMVSSFDADAGFANVDEMTVAAAALDACQDHIDAAGTVPSREFQVIAGGGHLTGKGQQQTFWPHEVSSSGGNPQKPQTDAPSGGLVDDCLAAVAGGV